MVFADLAIVAQVYSILPASGVPWSQAVGGLLQELAGWQFMIRLTAGTGYSFGGELGPVMLLCSAFALAFALEATRTRQAAKAANDG